MLCAKGLVWWRFWVKKFTSFKPDLHKTFYVAFIAVMDTFNLYIYMLYIHFPVHINLKQSWSYVGLSMFLTGRLQQMVLGWHLKGAWQKTSVWDHIKDDSLNGVISVIIRRFYSQFCFNQNRVFFKKEKKGYIPTMFVAAELMTKRRRRRFSSCICDDPNQLCLMRKH